MQLNKLVKVGILDEAQRSAVATLVRINTQQVMLAHQSLTIDSDRARIVDGLAKPLVPCAHEGRRHDRVTLIVVGRFLGESVLGDAQLLQLLLYPDMSRARRAAAAQRTFSFSASICRCRLSAMDVLRST